MPRLKHIGPLCLGRLLAVVMAGFGAVAGVAYSFGGAIYDLATTGSTNTGTALAFLALLGMPALFAAIGFLAGATSGLVYNRVAKRFGGIDLDIEV